MISFQNVKFWYPNSNKPVIDDLTLHIKKGSSIAIVGGNGAGKTTIAKLICRFYEPVSGEILWENKNINSIEFDVYRSGISALFQDFARFPLSVKENIDVRGQFISDYQLHELLKQVELGSLLHDKLENTLSKLVEDGIELSGGQWQRLAMTRVLADLIYNTNLKLLILDEPTSAMDPHFEYHMFELIRKIIKQKTSIIISHRLAVTRFVDRILVLENGRIIEDGNHTKLISTTGKYYEMFTKQASSYGCEL